jgi:hypothetical protein
MDGLSVAPYCAPSPPRCFPRDWCVASSMRGKPEGNAVMAGLAAQGPLRSGSAGRYNWSMRVTSVRASARAQRHMRRKHHVEFWQAEDVLLSGSQMRRCRHGRYFCDGRTEDGRLIRVIFETEGTGRDAVAWVVTAFAL